MAAALDHEPYIRVVVHALRAAGVGVAGWTVSSTAHRPLSAEIDLDAAAAERAGFGGLRVLVAWDEVRGWHFWPQDDGDASAQPGDRVEYLGTGLLPRPVRVAELVREVIVEDNGASNWTEPHYRDIGAHDDLAGQLLTVLDGANPQA